jgi:hypothetical protein
MNGKRPNKIQFLKSPDGHIVLLELLLILVKKMATKGSGQRSRGVSNEGGQGSQSAVDPRSKQVRITVFLALRKRGWAKYRIRVTPTIKSFKI